MTTILVIGGYGGFGGRLSRRLASRGYSVLVGGRDACRAAAFCRDLPGAEPVTVDRKTDLAPNLIAARPSLVIDAAGPFQDGDRRVAAACIAARIPYLDLADGRDFVAGIGVLDEAARSAGVAIISGASSVPALSGAVVRALAADMGRVSAIEIAISASNRATAGPSVARAILGYVGRPIALWRAGRWTTGHGWQDLRRECFALPGEPALTRLVALADVPDLAILPDRVAGCPAVTFRAGTELAFQNAALWLASWPVRWGWLRSLEPLARLLLPTQRLTARLGSDRSAMIVRLFGTAGGTRVERRWTLIAGNGEGPQIPTLAAAILADRIVAGDVAPGARDAGQALSLADFESDFADLSIRHAIETHPQPPPPYARAMGARFDRLPPPVAGMHAVLRDGGAAGRAIVTRGRHPLARLVAAVMRFPPAGDHPLHVAFSEREGVERWTRDFGGHRFSSELSQAGDGVVERFGPLRFHFDLPSTPDGLAMTMRGWSAFGIPLPLALAPRTAAREWAADGRFQLDVPVDLPWIGRVVRYTGWLALPETIGEDGDAR